MFGGKVLALNESEFENKEGGRIVRVDRGDRSTNANRTGGQGGGRKDGGASFRSFQNRDGGNVQFAFKFIIKDRGTIFKASTMRRSLKGSVYLLIIGCFAGIIGILVGEGG